MTIHDFFFLSKIHRSPLEAENRKNIARGFSSEFKFCHAMCFYQLCWDQFEVISPRSVFQLCTRACRHVRCTERSNFTLLWPRQINWPPTVRPALCSNDYWLLIDSFINCELLWLVPYHRVHMKTFSAGFLRPLRGRGWAAAAETDHSVSVTGLRLVLASLHWCFECKLVTNLATSYAFYAGMMHMMLAPCFMVFMSPWSKYFNISLTAWEMLYRAVSVLFFAFF